MQGHGDPFAEGVWRKSSYSASGGGQCVEVAVTDAVVGIRDTKQDGDPGGRPVLAVDADRWAAFLASVKSRERA